MIDHEKYKEQKNMNAKFKYTPIFIGEKLNLLTLMDSI